MNGRRDDVRRRFFCKLNDVLTKVGFDNLHPRGFERVVEMRLLGCHALALDDDLRLSGYCESTDDSVRFSSIARPMNHCAARARVAGKVFEISIEMRKHLVFDRSCLAA